MSDTQFRSTEAEAPPALAQTLQAVDTIVQNTVGSGRDQLALYILGAVLATRRLIETESGMDRAKRLRMIKAAGEEFDRKVRIYCRPLGGD